MGPSQPITKSLFPSPSSSVIIIALLQIFLIITLFCTTEVSPSSITQHIQHHDDDSLGATSHSSKVAGEHEQAAGDKQRALYSSSRRQGIGRSRRALPLHVAHHRRPASIGHSNVVAGPLSTMKIGSRPPRCRQGYCGDCRGVCQPRPLYLSNGHAHAVWSCACIFD